MRWVSLLIQSQVSTLSHECRHLNIWFTFGWASNSSTNLSQLPHIPSRVQECSHAAFVKYDPWSNLSSQPGDCAGIPLQGSPPSLCSKKKTVAIVTSSLPALNWLSLPSVFSGFISCGQAAARQVRAALGSVGWRSVWKAWGGEFLTHQVALACSLYLLEDVLSEGYNCCHFVTEPPKPQSNRLFASPSWSWLVAEPYCYLVWQQACHWSVGSLACPCSLTGIDFSLLVEKETWRSLFSVIARFCNST